MNIINLLTNAPELVLPLWFFSIVLTIAVTYHYTRKANNRPPMRAYLCRVNEPGKIINFSPKNTQIKTRDILKEGDLIPSSYYSNGLIVIKEISQF